MTRSEFDAWIEAHRGELMAVARRLVNNPADAEEIVHDAVVGVLATGSYARITAPWTRMVLAVQGAARNRRRALASRARLASGAPEVPDPIKAERGNKPGASPRRLLKLKRLSDVGEVDRWLQRQYLKQLERNRMDFDLDGYGRKTNLKDTRGLDRSALLDPHFAVRFPGDNDEHKPGPVEIRDGDGNLKEVRA